ncbi:3-deoxy-D-manno-octulosonic acid transferase [Alteromonas sp. 345S023]|uniref:3-deoxy-D-manno-octulosonic acid transferase n=1 Tax=Alteromonas profundi TaxID=2696062 RepID=A0A7X5LMF6_9ALTE|nr:3-deoxy-D-manno-octulosonic acid transferase [Alteromonas profundi]NDV92066.1 3-deoxy-D-manno-octulosonic acid transferase [Alteromonas profundi]
MSVVNNKQYRPTLLEDICRWGYSFLLVLAIPFAFVTLMRRGQTRNKDYNRRRFERFGFVSHPRKKEGYLFHCVSVGEVVAASCIIKRIMQDEPDIQITVTTTTPTGSARVQDIFGDSVHHFYLPYDLHMAMAGMIKRIRPKAVFITEVELWPNLIHACWKRNIPTMVVNARMTDRSARRYKKIGKLFNPMLNKLSHVCAQGKRDYDNYLFLGMPQTRLTLTNNIKFDQVASLTNIPNNFCGIEKGSCPVLVAGSTHELEEQMMIDTCLKLWPKHADLILVIVPRHPERFEHVAKLIETNKLDFIRTSQSNPFINHGTNRGAKGKVILLDEMGKLNLAYSIATIAFVGGSIADRGGHNALEPAAFSVPILMGPNTYNNPVICAYLKERGALYTFDNAEAFAAQCELWLSKETEQRAAGGAGRQVLDENKGALDATLACIRSVM